MEKAKINFTDNLMPLLRELVASGRVKASYAQLYKDVNKYWTGGDYVDTIIAILNKWGAKADLEKLTVEQLDDITYPMLIPMCKHITESNVAKMKMYLFVSKKGDKVKLFDTDKGYCEISAEKLDSLWINTAIVFEPNMPAGYNGPEECEKPFVSVMMPIYNQAEYVVAALNSLFSQTYKNWELVIINDGSTDNLLEVIAPFREDLRVKYIQNDSNEGLGYSLNKGIKETSHDLIAYLPSDDIWHDHHLASLVEVQVSTKAMLVYSSTMSAYFAKVPKKDALQSLQLLQVLHKKNKWKWLERRELVTNSLFRMYWYHFEKHADKIAHTYTVSCQWISHPFQRHKIIDGGTGMGMFYYKKYYNVDYPLKYHSTTGDPIDEIEWYAEFRNKKYLKNKDALKILIVGEIAYNPERIVALEERGHKLYGLWMQNPNAICTVGKLPFGNVIDIDHNNWQEEVKRIKPDIIYGMLNMWSIDQAYSVLRANTGIPFVWHFKEGPMFVRDMSNWHKLLYLYTRSSGVIYNSELYKDWLGMYYPKMANPPKEFVLDGDLPKKERFYDKRSPLLSDADGEIHTVIAGRPIGLDLPQIEMLAKQKIHVHLYGERFHTRYSDLVKSVKGETKKYFHLHSNCPQTKWVEEFSKYDAGWLHCFNSNNYGDVKKYNWDDVNLPARISTYAMAGLPMLLKDNSDHSVAMQEVVETKGMALTFDNFKDVHKCFEDRERLARIRENTWSRRLEFSFDYYVDDLIRFFRSLVKSADENTNNTDNKA